MSTLAGCSPRSLRRRLGVELPPSAQLRAARRMYVKARTDSDRQAIAQLIAEIESVQTERARLAEVIAQRRAELQSLKRGTLQERADELLRQIRERPGQSKKL